MDPARAQAETVRRAHPGYGIDDFVAAFRFDAAGERLFRRAARLVGVG